MDITDPRFQDADIAREWLETQRWPDGPVCSHCGSLSATSLRGKAHRPGLYQCNDCREQFTVTTGSVMERSKIPLNKWVLAMHLMGASKKGMSAHQLHRMLGITYQSAWFLAHRIREAMKETTTTHGPLGGEGKVVEADELYYGTRETPRPRNKYLPPPTKGGHVGTGQKRVILGLVERGGKVRTFHINDATTASISYVVRQNVRRESQLQTDEHRSYIELGKEFKGGHETVTHARNEYVRREADRLVTTNTIENVFSVFKRGMRGVYQHCGEAHLHRYLAEFDFRYNRRSAVGIEDAERAQDVAKGAGGKRLMYRSPNEAPHA